MTGGDRSRQAPWSTGALTRLVAIGVAGFLVAVLAQSLWLRQGRKAVAVYAASVQTSVAALVEAPAAAPSVVTSGGNGLVATAGIRHFHRPDCPIAAGRGWSAEPRRSHEVAGRTACGICTP